MTFCRRWFFCFGVLAIASSAWADADRSGPANLDFTKGPRGRALDGWETSSVDPAAYDYETRTDSAGAVLVIRGRSTNPAAYGFLSQTFDARPWRGRRVEFTASLGLTDSAGSSGELRILIYGPRGTQFNGNMDDHPVTSPAWTPARIPAEVADDARLVQVGVMLRAKGELRARDLRFSAVGAIGDGDLPPRPLTPRGLENLVALTRLLGYVRHFDPADAAAAADWSAFAIAAVDSVEGARSPDELANVLRRAFGPLDPVLRVDTRPVAVDTTLLRGPAPPDSIIAWMHHGYGPGDPTTVLYWSQRQGHPAGDARFRPGPARVIAADLGGGVWCAVPLSLWVNSGGTWPHAQTAWMPRPRPQGFMPTGNDRSTRLADVALLWNIIQHFFPYFDVVHADWDAALREALREAATDTSAVGFRITLQRMMAHLDDSHAWVGGPGGDDFGLPFAWGMVEGRILVTWTPDSAGAVRRGDIVRAVDGVPVENRYTALLPRISAATDGWRRFRALQMLPGLARESLLLEVEGVNGHRRNVTVYPSPPLSRGAGRPAPIAELRQGIWYVDVSRVTDATFTAAVDTLARARGVIFDLRGYPYNLGISPLGHLSDSAMTSPRLYVPIVTAPDHRGMAFEDSSWSIPPEQPRFRGRIAFLISGRAISYSETWLGIAEHYRLGEFVGEPTAGTNGSVNIQTLPGGYRFVFTGMKVLKQDGSRHHGVGIRPTVPVSPTIAGVRAGRDEQLEKAIEVVGS